MVDSQSSISRVIHDSPVILPAAFADKHLERDIKPIILTKSLIVIHKVVPLSLETDCRLLLVNQYL